MGNQYIEIEIINQKIYLYMYFKLNHLNRLNFITAQLKPSEKYDIERN